MSDEELKELARANGEALARGAEFVAREYERAMREQYRYLIGELPKPMTADRLLDSQYTVSRREAP